jgi:carboxyl-terminal processing protease
VTNFSRPWYSSRRFGALIAVPKQVGHRSQVTSFPGGEPCRLPVRSDRGGRKALRLVTVLPVLLGALLGPVAQASSPVRMGVSSRIANQESVPTTSEQVTSTPAPPTTQNFSTTNPDVVGLPSGSDYLKIGLDFIERFSYAVPSINWKQIRQSSEARVANSTSVADVHAVLIDVVKKLGDHHSSFTRPPDAVKQTAGKYNGYGFLAVLPSRLVITVVAGSPSSKAGLRVGDRIDLLNGKAITQKGDSISVPRDKNGNFPSQIVLTVTRKGVKRPLNLDIKLGEVTLVSVPKAESNPALPFDSNVGYLDVPGIVGDAAAQQLYATQLHEAIRSVDTTPRCGWVVDLRKNRGGYIYAMLAGLGPIIGEGLIGGERDGSGKIREWRYQAGAAVIAGSPAVKAENPYSTKIGTPAVAVLTSRLTASAAEASAIAFRGRPATRSFGEPTLGIPTFNSRRQMPDGAFLDVMSAVDVDRTGTAYASSVAPDEVIRNDWNAFATAADPVLAAATKWLEQQPACTA